MSEAGRVCVIGAGSSGIAACQVLTARGIDFDCFELSSEIGGDWGYRNDNRLSAETASSEDRVRSPITKLNPAPLNG